jgi:Tfp pilus assembly protein PilP
MTRSVLITPGLLLLLLSAPSFGDSFEAPASPIRNPFVPVKTSPTSIPLTDRPPLERYPISALTLTAIITNAVGERYASVENPEGIGYKVVKGTMLGNAHARVVEISTNGLVVEESHSQGSVRREIPLRTPR